MLNLMKSLKNIILKAKAVKVFSWQTAVFIACLGGLFLSCSFFKRLESLPIRILGDFYDLYFYYFVPSRWVMGNDVLYINLRSDYPFLANLLFGLVRCIAIPLSNIMQEFTAFCWIWSSLFLLVFFFIMKKIMTEQRSKLFLWIIFAPSTIYFALYRYDLYPAVCCLMSLLALKEDQLEKSALWLGASIALKGYGVVLLPSLIIFLYPRTTLHRICKILCLIFAPLILSSLIVIAWWGIDALMVPYSFQVKRIYNGESSYNAFFYILYLCGYSFSSLTVLSEWLMRHHIPITLQLISSVVIPLVLPPRDWQELLEMWIFVLLGFISFSVFNSPQYLIWVAIPACLLPVSRPLIGIIVFAWMNYLYYPVAHDLIINDGNRFFHLFMSTILVVTVLRFLIMADLLYKRLSKDGSSL